MKFLKWAITPIFLFPILSHAFGSTNNSSQAVTHSAAAAVHLSAAGIQTASAIVAIPLLSIGAIGSVSLAAGTSLLEISDKEFEIDSESFSILPAPDEALDRPQVDLQ